MTSLRLWACVFLICGVSTSSSRNRNLTNEVQYRLPAEIVPTKYTIDLEFLGLVFTEAGNTFTGKVKIEFKLNEEASALKFHASNNYIQISKLALNDKELIKDDNYTVDATTDIVTVPLEGYELEKDTAYYVEIEYTGIISTTDNYGIYKSSYTKLDGDISYLLATQFEATYARRAFPCFDEPSFKATFDVSITYSYMKEWNLGVLFNTKALPSETSNETTDDYSTKVTFETTPIMSTYLVAFTISDFTSTEGTNAINGTEYAVWSREDLASSRDYAAEIGPKILNALNDYTGRNYNTETEIQKIDQVALPDFAAGAMENWGLVTYRERYLLWDKDNTVDTVKQSIATIIAHEFAHQWFGNLITCDWWSEIYLNEGFATYFEYFTTHEVEPTWELDKQFVVSVLQPVLDSDSLEHSQALKSDANTPQEISNKFGVVSYSKGGSILRMLSHIMGEDNFKGAVREYVQTSELQFATSTTSKLWEIFEQKVASQYSGFPDDASLANIMENWIEKPGYPLLTVSLDGKDLTVSQERFLLSGEDKESKWYVPISYVESESDLSQPTAQTAAWLTPSDTPVTLSMEYENDWVLLNTYETGYYRVNYESSLWTNIAAGLLKEEFDGILELNRAQIVDDLFNIAKAKKITYPEVFNVIEFLKNDVSYFSWVPAFTGFQYVLLRIPSNTQLKTKLQEHLLRLMDKMYKTVPISQTKEDQIIYTLTQSLASSWACLLGEESCVTESIKLFSESTQSETKPAKNIRSVVYCNGLRYSNATSGYDYLWNLYGKTEESNEKVIILRALGCSTNATQLKDLLSETLKDDSQIRSQDAAAVFSYVYSGSEEGVDAALEFLIDNFKAILTKYSSMSAQSTLIKGIASRLTTAEQVTKLQEFIKAHTEFENDLKQVSQEALELAESNIEWLSTHQTDLEKYYGIFVEPPVDDDDEKDEEDDDGGANAITVNLVVLIVVSIIGLFGV